MGRRVEQQRSGPGPKKTVSRPVLLDTSFLVALERETARGDKGPARRFLPSLRGRQLIVSIVTVEELLGEQPTSQRPRRHYNDFPFRGCISRRPGGAR